mgnify:CR=1 FL=1
MGPVGVVLVVLAAYGVAVLCAPRWPLSLAVVGIGGGAVLARGRYQFLER